MALYKPLPSNCINLQGDAITSWRKRESNSQQPVLLLTTHIESAPSDGFREEVHCDVPSP
jgi:hypothetical protein